MQLRIFQKPPKSKSTTYFSFGKGQTPARHVKYHSTGAKKTARKFTLLGNMFPGKVAQAKRKGSAKRY